MWLLTPTPAIGHACPLQDLSNKPESYVAADAQAKLAVNTKALSDLSFSFHYKVSRITNSWLHVPVHAVLTRVCLQVWVLVRSAVHSTPDC